jgi:hypothetical protein
MFSLQLQGKRKVRKRERKTFFVRVNILVEEKTEAEENGQCT